MKDVYDKEVPVVGKLNFTTTSGPKLDIRTNQQDFVKEEEEVEDFPLKQVDPWIHRADNMRCKTCMWFVRKEKTGPTYPGSPEIGRCRRHAPTFNGFPAVFEKDWCGDHRIDENKI